MKIVIAGGTGFIGRRLCQRLSQEGHQVLVLSRNPAKHRHAFDQTITLLPWTPESGGDWKEALEGTDALVNLVGEPIANGRWTRSRKQKLTESRINSTKIFVQALSKVSKSPRILLNASGIGFYGARGDASVSEQTEAGSGFLAGLCTAWEHEALNATELGVRVVIFRIGLVLGSSGGALQRMILPFKLYAGGPILPGDQWVSWIHVDDLSGLMAQALVHESIHGPVNAVAPNPVTMKEFCKTLGLTLNRPSWMPVPQFLLKLGLGELSTLMTTGQRAEPTMALNSGYVFTYPELGSALESILKKPERQNT